MQHDVGYGSRRRGGGFKGNIGIAIAGRASLGALRWLSLSGGAGSRRAVAELSRTKTDFPSVGGSTNAKVRVRGVAQFGRSTLYAVADFLRIGCLGSPSRKDQGRPGGC